MNRVGVWAFGLIGSITAHFGLLALLVFAVQPDPVTDQPSPTSELEVQAYQLDRTDAQEHQPDSEQTDANTPDGQALDAGAIARSRAQVAQPESERLRPGASTIPAASEVAAPALTVAQTTPISSAIPELETDIAAIHSVDAPIQTVPQSLPTPARLSSGSQPPARLEPALVTSASLTASVAPTVLAAPAVVRAQTAMPVAQPAVAIIPISPPQGPPVLTARPEFSTTKAIAPATKPLAVAIPAVVATLPMTAAAEAVSVSVPRLNTVESQPAPSAPIATAQPDLDNAPISEPARVAIPQALVESDAATPAVPEFVAAASQQTNAPLFQPTTPNAQKLKAALAFSGGEGDVDPVSIAAFQSFMQPGDIATTGDQLRDGVAGLLAQVPCSRMQVSFDPDTATLQVKGHIPEDGLRAPVLAALQAKMGANITVSDNILILPRPQCGALSGIAGVGLPQSTEQITNPLVIGNDAHAKVFKFSNGDLLSLDMTAPDYNAFIYLDYFDAAGMVLHLEPNEYAPLRQANAEVAQQIGAKTMQDAGLKLVISPPYGQEIAVAFAASVPLYQGLRPIQEPAAEYLVWLQAQVERARAETADFKGEWVYFFVSTAAR